MEYPLEVIKDDLSKMKPYEFYQKYIMRSYNWYFEHVLLGKDHNILEIADDFKFIISKGLGIILQWWEAGNWGIAFLPLLINA